eukprot:2213954-Pyramimonas_sp.AAC.1
MATAATAPYGTPSKERDPFSAPPQSAWAHEERQGSRRGKRDQKRQRIPTGPELLLTSAS